LDLERRESSVETIAVYYPTWTTRKLL